jgi:hypothetical protein
MKIVKIKAYKFEELDKHRQFKVAVWLDEWPINYEDDNGNTKWEYFSDIYHEEPEYVAEHCEANEYLFNKFGEPIHHLIKE